MDRAFYFAIKRTLILLSTISGSIQARVSKGAALPLAHDFPSGKSSVLYLYEIVAAGKKFYILAIIQNSRHSVLQGTP